MSGSPTVALVVPTYNRPSRLRNCLRSVLAGQQRPDEIWVCDQTRHQATRVEVEAVCADLGVSYLHLDTPNASMARNAGVQAASTELVAFTDDDCLAARGWLAALTEEYARTSRQEPLAAVTGRVLPYMRANGAVAVSSRVSTSYRLFRAWRGGMDRGEWAPWDTGNGPNILVPRNVFIETGGFDVALGPGTPAGAAEDIDLLYRIARDGTIAYQPRAVVYHLGKSRKARLLSRFNYGLGMGTMLARHMGKGDRTARSLLWLYVRHQLRNTYRSGPWGLPETALVFSGMIKAVAILLNSRGKGHTGERVSVLPGVPPTSRSSWLG